MASQLKQQNRNKMAFFKGLLIGFLPFIAACLLVLDRPSDVAVIFTGLPLGLDDRALKIPLCCGVLGLFFWTSYKLKKSGKITVNEQLSLVIVATTIAAAWLWIFVRMLDSAFRTLGW